MSTRTPSQKAACAHMQTRRRRLQALGQWQPYVDAEPVREHLRTINAMGMSYPAIADRLGLPQSNSLQHVLWGRGTPEPGQKIKRETAELVLAFWPTLDDYPDTALIDATGTRRRVQALAVRGWARHLIAVRLEMDVKYFRKAVGRQRVSARLARGVAAVYDALWDQDPLQHGVSWSSVSRVKADAERGGFHGPLAWDEETIDDPAALPKVDAVVPVTSEGGNLANRWLMGESVILGPEDRKEVLRHLFEWTNHTTAEIAEQLDMTPAAAEQAWMRMKKRAAAEGRRLWRRVYVPRERALEQDDMEEVA